jgi:hypothetical protein
MGAAQTRSNRLRGWAERRLEGWSTLRRTLAGVALLCMLFTLVQGADYGQNVPSNDTYQYARQTLLYMGESHAAAVHGATAMFCRDAGEAAIRSAEMDDGSAGTANAAAVDASYDACMHVYADGLTPRTARYIAIFTSRPGYPLLSATFGSVVGLRLGMWLAAMLCTLLASILVFTVLRVAGAGVLAGLGGQALYLAAPTGYWGSRMLTDGPALAATLLTLLGALWLMRGRRLRAGAAALLAGGAAGFVIRYSTETMVLGALFLAALVLLWRVPAARHRGTVWMAVLTGGGALVAQLASTLLGWPGIVESMQDTFTKHFLHPNVSDPVGRLVVLNLRFWAYYPVLQSTSLVLVFALIVVGVALWRRKPAYAVLVIAVAATGVGTVAAHPLASQADRLMVAVWLLVVLGVPMVVPGRRRPAVPAEPAGQVPLDADSAERRLADERADARDVGRGARLARTS